MVRCFADYYGNDPYLSQRIITCEGGFSNPGVCNGEYGCRSGQGAWQIVPLTWKNIINAGVLPARCTIDSVLDFRCNVQGGAYLLSIDGTGHWGTEDSWSEELGIIWGSWACWNK